MNPGVTIEVLIPDFDGKESSVDVIISKAPEVVNHNIETVKSLYRAVRPGAHYERSLAVLARISEKRNGSVMKSGMMVGLGETQEQVFRAMDDLLETGVQILTIGQYLRPTREHHDVKRYVTPDEFEAYREVGLEKGFLAVASGPFVRSSYGAEELYEQVRKAIRERERGD